MSRSILRDKVWLACAYAIAQLGTCARRKVGVVFIDKLGRVLATGYNGVAPGETHCTDVPCPGVGLPSGTGLELCRAIHAEQNALIQLSDMDKVHTIYCTTAPCMHCVKMLARTSAQRIVFMQTYPHAEEAEKEWLRKAGRTWEHRSMEGA